MPTVTDFTGSAGRLEALLDLPPDVQEDSTDTPPIHAAVVFAHPHPQFGGTMHTKVMYQGAKGLARIGCAVLRFNFRGVGASAGTFDQGEGEQADFRAALDYMSARYPGRPLWAAGFSFGAWVALEVGAADDRVSTLIGIAPPVASSISGMSYEFSATLESEKPKFLIQGEADEICPLEALWRFYGRLKEPKELVVIDAADHLFEGKTQEVGEALQDLLEDF
jgi:alpha/beta superfamily hydrolase